MTNALRHLSMSAMPTAFSAFSVIDDPDDDDNDENTPLMRIMPVFTFPLHNVGCFFVITTSLSQLVEVLVLHFYVTPLSVP
jgi:hypothetical protein